MIGSLRLQDFRCFGQLSVEIPVSGALLTGDNAQGKTSILEAACVLVRLHSPRTHKLGPLGRTGGRGFGVAGETWGSERCVRQGPDGLRLTVDGVDRAGPGEYLSDGGLLVWLGNEDLELIRGGAEARRRYLDFLGSQLDPAYRRAFGRYRQALRARNLLLKEAQPNEREIRAYDAILIENGMVLARVRADLVAGLGPLVEEAQMAVAGKREKVTLGYAPSGGPDLGRAFDEHRERDRRLRQTTTGPHRDELHLRLDGMPAADFASEGQQRTLALALKLAQGTLLEKRRGVLPVYLFDDIFGELDPGRRNALMNHLPPRAQKWITTTNLGWWRETTGVEELARFAVRNGTVEPVA